MVRIRLFLLLLLILNYPLSAANILSDSSAMHRQRLAAFIGSSTVIYTGAMVGLNTLWYKDYPRSSFHFINDNRQWMQIDKGGHFFSSYYLSILGIQGLRWAGIDQKKATYWGGLFGFICMTPIEILDGFSDNWGASWGDLILNTSGSVFAIGQFLLWNEQRFLFKLSYFPSIYAPMRPDEFGTNLPSKLFKDYNGHTFWMSIPFNTILPGKNFMPDWLCISFGYGADEVLGGTKRTTPIEFMEYNPYRQFYISFDINTLNIKTKSRALKYLLIATSLIKFPAPAIEFNGSKNTRFHLLYF